MAEAERYCMNVLARDGGEGLCNAAIDRAVSRTTGKPSAYDLCLAGDVTACEIALEDMRPSDPRYDYVYARAHHGKVYPPK